MIRLRHALQRGLRHPVLGPILLVLLAIVMVMVVVHSTHDQAHQDSPLFAACIALALFALVVLLVSAPRANAPAAWSSARAPPPANRYRRCVPLAGVPARSFPLRL